MKYAYILPLLTFMFYNTLYGEDLNTLLDGYAKESDLSKITKKDTAGILQVLTRDDLQKMQVHNLTDVLNSISGIYLKRGTNNLVLFSRPSISSTPLTLSRLYINDHDVTSSSFGSAFMMWGEMPVEYIDHIEVYKASSSLAFGNENAALIIRLYTKTAQRDSGTKVRVLADEKGSHNANIYTADILQNGLSYFAYANTENLHNDVYHNTYNNKTYDYKSDKKSYNLFANLQYKNNTLDIGSYKKENDNFIGIGSSLHKTPEGGSFNAEYHYIHLTTMFQNDIKLQLSYDTLEYERVYKDPNGIRIANAPVINDYKIVFNDDIFSVILEKRFDINKHHLLLGAFYKHKAFKNHGRYHDTNLSYDFHGSFSNALNLYSVYAEDVYKLSASTHFFASIKGDFFRYQTDVKQQNEFLARVGVIQMIDKLKLKLFYTNSYIPLGFYQTYNPDNTPYRSNPDLDTQKAEIYTLSLIYKDNHQDASINIVQRRNKDIVAYNPTTANGWVNSSQKSFMTIYQLDYTYTFDLQNKLLASCIYGENSMDVEQTPPLEIRLQSYNSYKQFDFYNAVVFRDAYSYYNMNVGDSYEVTSALKYHYTQDLSFGIRGENIFKSGYKQVFQGVDYAINVTEQKFWLNMEYTF